MMIDEIKKEIIYSENLSRLFEIMIDVSQRISKLHVDLAKSEDTIKKVELKGEVSVLYVMQSIIDKRINDVRADNYDKERKELYINRKFKKVAETVLHRETYERINELSLLNYKKFKELKTELKDNKIE
jgi:replicative DNA helicase